MDWLHERANKCLQGLGFPEEAVNKIWEEKDWGTLASELTSRGKIQKYYEGSFDYEGEYVSFPDSYPEAVQAQEDNIKAHKAVEDHCALRGWVVRNSYSWPDGSLYLYIAADVEGSVVEEHLQGLPEYVRLSGSLTSLPPAHTSIGSELPMCLIMLWD